MINKDIVDVIIGDILFNPDNISSAQKRARALGIFKLFRDAGRAQSEGENVNIETYEVKILSSRGFELVLGYLFCGASFRVAFRHASITHTVSEMGFFAGSSEEKWAMYTRVICAANFQKLSELASRYWSFAIALDVPPKQETSYMDLRTRICYNGYLMNFHVLWILFYNRETAEIIFNCFGKALDILFPDWRNRLLAVSTDGGQTMTGCISGVTTLFQQETSHSLVRIWCTLYQFYLVLQKK